jgi:hypothetical protein
MTKARDLANIISGGFTEADIPNLSAGKITSGQFANSLISSSAVSQHATSFDDNKIVNDISTLAIRQASDQNKSAYNTNSQSVDVFQDNTGIDTTTNAIRNASEYVSSSSLTTNTATINTQTFTDATGNYSTINSTDVYWRNYGASGALGGSVSMYTGGGQNKYLNIPNNNSFIHQLGSSDFTIEMFVRDGQTNNHRGLMGYSDGSVQALQIATNPTNAIFYWASSNGSSWNIRQENDLRNPHSNGAWFHIAISRESGQWYAWNNGARVGGASNSSALVDENSDFRIFSGGNVTDSFDGYIDQFAVSDVARYSGSTYTVPSGSNGYTIDSNHKLVIGSKTQTGTFNATGNFTGTTITAPSSVSNMGAIITYQDQSGTNALNTDIVLQLSADGGSNYSTATMTALPDFATGIKMAKVNDLSVTAGTSLKYKISFANQASGSKEARIRGVSLQY